MIFSGWVWMGAVFKTARGLLLLFISPNVFSAIFLQIGTTIQSRHIFLSKHVIIFLNSFIQNYFN